MGKRGFVQCGHFADKEDSSDADVHTFGAKTLNFSKFIVCPHGQSGMGVSQCRHFTDKGEGLIFREWMAP